MTSHDTADLLLFASGEMPPQQQDQFSHRLAQEPQLAAALVEIQTLNSRIQDHFARAERHEHPTLMEARRSAAVRKVSRSIVQKRLLDYARAALVGKRPWKRPRWAYPVAAAALLIAGFFSFVQWGSNIQGNNNTDDEMSIADVFDGSRFGGGGRPSHIFHDGVFPMDDTDFQTLQIAVDNYDPAAMFKLDDVN